MKTAEEFLLEINQFSKIDIKNKYSIDYAVKQKMIEFAKMHVEAALKKASKKAKIVLDPNDYTGNTGSEYDASYIIDKNSILNSYPLTDIK